VLGLVSIVCVIGVIMLAMGGKSECVNPFETACTGI
jgi:hypothetical protein